MNKGIKLSRGQWLYFMGSDDVLFSPNVLNEIFSKNIGGIYQLIIGNAKYKGDLNLFKSKWSKLMWIKNTIHHQSVFYRRELFNKNLFSLDYKILSDYHFNLNLFKQEINILKIPIKIAICGINGVSKNYNWKLYNEEIILKSEVKGKIYYPIFFIIGLIKFFFKKL